MKNNVREFRILRGISQSTLAEAVGTTKRTIYSIEVENKDIHLSLAQKLATFFSCSIDDLFVFDKSLHTTADKAVWFAHVVRYIAEELGKSIRETIKLLEKNDFVQSIILGYDVWHTQGYEYMAEMLADELNQRIGA